MDDHFNKFIQTSPTIPSAATEQDKPPQLQTHQHPITTAMPSNSIATCRNRHADDDNENTPSTIAHEQQIHSISSSDEELNLERNTIEEDMANMSSEESCEFEGFDDYTTLNSSDLINDTSQEDFNISSNYLKRHSHVDFIEYQSNSGRMLQSIDVDGDDDDEEILIGEDGKIIYNSKEKVTSKKIQTYRWGTYGPDKRKKHPNETDYNPSTPPDQLKTPPDQIVEVNSDSTTNSLKQKRQQINDKFQLNFCQQQNHKASNNPNKCSTESTSEFPVSSPSNPQQPRCGKYIARPPLLKNTLPADSFERQLAMITACNPQMTLAEKIQSWECEEELSDLEDVYKFDEEFKRVEKQKKLEMKQKDKRGCVKSTEMKNYDFFTFCQTILNNIKEQKNQKYNGQGGAGGGGVPGAKCVNRSGSESSSSVVHVDDRPSTSAVAQQQLQQRRSKVQLCLEATEVKKRVIKDIHKRNQNSTTPPQTSSSDNERDIFQNAKNNSVQRQIHTHDTLICPSSSEDAISQDVPSHVMLKTNNKCPVFALKNETKKSSVRIQPSDPLKKSNDKNALTKNPRVLTNEEIDSVFRLHQLNRERDKYNRSQINDVEGKSTSIIQMRLDFTNKNETALLMEKKEELFKTPIIPQKYLPNPLMTGEYQRQNNFLPMKNFKTNEEIKADSLTANSLLNINSPEVKSSIDDLEGIYHQQHEFCNYLGLTGMSTATAMANAVAELAQCNLARRSMRVLRQQQQERRDKSAKEERVKIKQLKEIRKREKEGCDIVPAIETEQTIVLKSDEGSNSQASEPTSSLKKISNKFTPKLSPQSSNSFTALKEPEIKILGHVAPKHTEAECSKKTLMRQAKQHMSKKLTDLNKEAHDTSNDIYIKSFKINQKEKADSVEEKPLMEKEAVTRSPILSTGESSLKNTRSRSRISYEPKGVVRSKKMPAICKLEFLGETESLTKSIDTKCESPFSKAENSDKIEINNEHCNAEKMSLFNSDMNLIAAAPNIIQQKLQMALEESRKSKPSIFIVQSLECKTEKENDLNIQSCMSAKSVDIPPTLPSTIKQCEEINNEIKKSSKSSITKFSKNNKRKVVTHKGTKYPGSKRQLRKRKLIVIKTSKPKHKSYENLNLIKRELRSSPRINENQRQNSIIKKNENYKQEPIVNKKSVANESKSYRTVHTETKDLEIYLNSRRKTRLMAKASALLDRSKRMTLRGSCNLENKNSKLAPKIQRSKYNLHGTRKHILKSRRSITRNNRKNTTTSAKIQQIALTEQNVAKQITENNTSSSSILLEIENVVVSSTTNTYDERPSHEPLANPSSINLRSLHNTASYGITSSPIKTKDQITQCNFSTGVHYINPRPLQAMRNPLKSQHGVVLYIYNELDVIIVIQERLVSFWKCPKLINMFTTNRKIMTCTHQTVQNTEPTLIKQNLVENVCNNQLGQPTSSSTIIETNDCGEWILLGELRRLTFDFEISVPYANRICLHNSIPIYLEMRAQQLPKNQRDCNLLSMYINIYYYYDEDMIAKCNSIPLDSIQSDLNSINYTTLTDSRYFIITWPQENLLGKTRSGICKYSLTPQLDTLASIREFKSMRHIIRYLECMSDDKLIGFGETQVTIWDYRSGDVLMNFDLEMPMGRNLGSIYISSQDIEQNNMLILHQFRNLRNNTPPELITIACTVTHTQPSYRVLQETNLPMPAFKIIKSAIKTGDHIVVTAQNEDELWISLTKPILITVIPNTQNSKRFYGREKSQLIELTEKTLNVNSLTNHILQLAAGLV